MYTPASVKAAYQMTNAQLWKEVQQAGVEYPRSAKGMNRDELVGMWLEHYGHDSSFIQAEPETLHYTSLGAQILQAMAKAKPDSVVWTAEKGWF